MNRDQLRARVMEELDVDDNGKISIDDAITFFNMKPTYKVYAAGVVCFIVGLVIGRFVL